ncbi:MAG TPA: HutD family protein [Dokdonella sp.]
MTILRPIGAAEYRRVRWKNDGGWTTELARDADAGGDAFRWRVSIAEIERDGPFSRFPGVERDLLLLDGAGLELEIDGGPARRLAWRFERAHFAGEADVHCRLLGGPTRDFNVMVRRDALRAEVVARPLAGSMVILPEAGAEWFVHVFAGGARASGDAGRVDLDGGASLHVDFRDGGRRVVLEGGGELVLAKFVPAAAAR